MPAVNLPTMKDSADHSGAGAEGMTERGSAADRWCVLPARRASAIVDAAAYYRAVREALIKARHNIIIVGWDIDGRTLLCDLDDPPDDGYPVHLRDLLVALIRERRELDVYVLLWDFTVLYSMDRELLPSFSLGWSTPSRLHFGLDDAIPFGASQHEKIVAIDDSVVFTGGLDIALKRWDTTEHHPVDYRRVDPSGDHYPAFHDVQMIVDGDAARALVEHARGRWRLATGVSIKPNNPVAGPPTDGAVDPWPDSVPVDAGPVDISISRTCAPHEGREGACEIRNLYVGMIGRAEKYIYIENQYLTSEAVAKALRRRLEAPNPPDVVMVSSRTAMGWLEDATMGAGRVVFMNYLRESGVWNHVRVVYPFVNDEAGKPHEVKVHAKLMVVDDRFATVGSANLANRSMGLDCEINLSVDGSGVQDLAFCSGLRNRLLGEHLGLAPDEVGRRLEAGETMIHLIDREGDGRNGRGLSPVPAGDPGSLTKVAPLTRLGDPEAPIELESLLENEAPPPLTADRRPTLRHVWVALLIVLGLTALILVWRHSPLQEWVDPQVFARLAEGVREAPWTPLIVLVTYVVLGMIAFPVTVLIAATAAVFGPWLGFVYALSGSILSAYAAYGVGRLAGRDLVRRYAGRTVNRLSRRIARHGILTVVVLRVAPVAPFTLINLIAGASRVKAVDFLAGTLIGMTPGIIVMTVFGDKLAQVLSNPEPQDYFVLSIAAVAWVTLSIVLQRIVSRIRRRRAGVS